MDRGFYRATAGSGITREHGFGQMISLKIPVVLLAILHLSIAALPAIAQQPSSAESNSADVEIKNKLNELIKDPNSSLSKMKTFEQQGEESTMPALRPLAGRIGREINCRVLRANSFTGKFVAVSVRVENKSDKTLVVDGDQASVGNADSASTATPCLTQTNLDSIGKPPSTTRAKISTDFKSTIAAALTIGAIPTAETIITEHGPISKRYEWDEQRREHEESRFGKRLLYPGDKSDGIIYFAGSVSFDRKSLIIPVKSFYDGADQASLIEPIPQAN